MIVSKRTKCTIYTVINFYIDKGITGPVFAFRLVVTLMLGLQIGWTYVYAYIHVHVAHIGTKTMTKTSKTTCILVARHTRTCLI